MPSKPNMIASLRGKHDPHYKLAGRVEGLEKDLPRQLNQLHKTLSKSFGMQRKTLMRVLGLETRVAELEAAEAGVDQAVEEQIAELEEVVGDVDEVIDESINEAIDDAIPVGLDDILDDIRNNEKVGASIDGIDPEAKKKPAAKKKRPVTPTAKKIPKKKKPSLKAKKKKVSPEAFKKGTTQEVPEWFRELEAKQKAKKEREERLAQNARDVAAGDLHRQTDQYKETKSGLDQGGGELSNEERIRRFKLRKRGISPEAFKTGSSVGGAQKTVPADTTGASDIVKAGQAPDVSTDVTPEGEAGAGKGTAGLLAPLQEINKSLDNISKSFTEGAKADKDAADDARKADEKKKRKGAEGALEKIGGVAVKGVQAVLKPAMGIFERIWQFLKTVLLGRIVMNVFDYFAKNQDKLASLFKFVKDWWPVLVAGILAIFGPILGPGAWVVGVGALVWWGVNRITALVKFVGNLFGNIWKFITGGAKEGEKAEADALKETKDFDDSDLKEGEGEEDPPSGDTAKLDDGQKAVDESQKLKEPAESGDEPEKMNKGGQVPGQGDTDTVPAMLTPGEFVMSKGAVQQYGVDTLENMNAAAGGTNKPQEKQGTPAFKGGGISLPRTPIRYYSGGGEVAGEEEGGGKKKGGIGGFLGGMAGKLIENNPMIKMILKPLIKGVKNLIVGVHNTMHGEQKGSVKNGKVASPAAKVTPTSSATPSAAKKPTGMMRGFAGIADAMTGGVFDFDKQGGGGADIIKKMKGAGGTDIKPPVKHDHPVTVAYDNEVLKAQKPLPGGQPPQQDLPSFDAGAMVSMSKIKTLGISV